jgi:hypothetical protein
MFRCHESSFPFARFETSCSSISFIFSLFDYWTHGSGPESEVSHA